jgi:phosphohistidine phosphatase
MQLLVIRHAIAEPRVEDGGDQPDDRLRELTPKGRRRMKRGARGLEAVQSGIDILATSPLARATQTASIVADAYGVEITTIPELSPGAGSDAVEGWLRSVELDGTVAIVGHEPDLSELVTHLLTGRSHSFLSLGKGGACLLEIPAGVSPGPGRLLWLLSPGQLRRLGRKK